MFKVIPVNTIVKSVIRILNGMEIAIIRVLFPERKKTNRISTVRIKPSRIDFISECRVSRTLVESSEMMSRLTPSGRVFSISLIFL